MSLDVMFERKWQVFVSSTYEDMAGERAAAVESILAAGHIPAGMELFAASNQSQLKTIFKWIEACELFILILGGRYGSRRNEKSRSYIDLELRRARKLQKPIGVILPTREYLLAKAARFNKPEWNEMGTPRYDDFRRFALGDILVGHYEDIGGLKHEIDKTLRFYEHAPIVGWVREQTFIDYEHLQRSFVQAHAEMTGLRQEVARLKAQVAAFEPVPEAVYQRLKLLRIDDLPEELFLRQLGKNAFGLLAAQRDRILHQGLRQTGPNAHPRLYDTLAEILEVFGMGRREAGVFRVNDHGRNVISGLSLYED